MSSNSILKPTYTMADLFPPKTVFAPRSRYNLMFWALEAEYRLDTASGVQLNIMGEMPLICHESTVTPMALEFFKESGLTPASNIIAYRTESEAVSLALEAVRKGYKIAYPYPPPPPLESDDALLFPVSLYNWLNDKKNLGRLVDDEYLPEHIVVDTERLSAIMDFAPDKPVFVKACHSGASGGGRDVRYCPDAESRKKAVEWITPYTNDLSAIRIELEAETGTSWCVNVAALESEVIYLGSASQIFEKPAHQTGNRIDPSDLPPAGVIEIAIKAADRARNMGYRGIAGFDIACDKSGRPVVFDLNFRLAASTKMILLYDAITRRAGGGIAESWSQTITGSIAPTLDILREYVQSGKFAPTRLYEANPQSDNRSIITGIIAAGSVEEVASIDKAMTASLGDIITE